MLGEAYMKVVGGRCKEFVGVTPIGGRGKNWTQEMDKGSKAWCSRRNWCVGYMRFMGSPVPVHCHEWCGRPQFCLNAELEDDDKWVTYLRREAVLVEVEGKTVMTGGPRDIGCSWPYSGNATLWFEEPPPEELASYGLDHEEAPCHVLLHQRGAPVPKAAAHRKSFEDSEEDKELFHGILSETEELVKWFTADKGSVPWIYFFDPNEYLGETVEGGGAVFGPKLYTLSLFFTSPEATCDGKSAGEWTPQRAEEVIPGNVFVDDGTLETRREAFNPYHFTIICTGNDNVGRLPQAVIDATGFATHPLVPKKYWNESHKVFWHLPDALQGYTRIHPYSLAGYLEDLFFNESKNEAMYYKQSFLFLMQDLFRYRYRQELWKRREVAACALCTERRRLKKLDKAKEPEKVEEDPAAAVGVVFSIMTRHSSHKLRAAIRETWGQLLYGTTALRFFVGRVLEGEAAGQPPEDAEAGDVVELGVPEAYEAVTLKAFAMLFWAHSNFPNLRFLVRADDDIYLRPGLLLDQLERRPPVSYLWGNFDHGSNPVRDPEHAHYNSYTQMPKRFHPLFGDIFPPYARGHLWAMSADLLTFIADVWRGEVRLNGGHENITLDLAHRLPHPDDPALGLVLSDLVDVGELSLNIDDRDLNTFSLNPSCNATYLNIHNRTWVVHHVDSEAMRCMWAIDAAAGVVENKGELPRPLPDLCPCSMEVVEVVNEKPGETKFDYPRDRFND